MLTRILICDVEVRSTPIRSMETFQTNSCERRDGSPIPRRVLRATSGVLSLLIEVEIAEILQYTMLEHVLRLSTREG